MMISAFTTATAGLYSSAQRFEKSAQDVVKASSLGTASSTTSNSTEKDSGDLPTAIVGTKEAEISFKANAAVFKTADTMMGTLLDTLT